MAVLSKSIRAFLEEPRFGVLATINPDGSVQQTVMWFALDGDELLMNTARGRRKDLNVLRDPRVSICFEDAYRYLTLRGTVEVVDDHQTSQADALLLARRYHTEDEAQEMMREHFGKQQRISLRIRVDGVDARGFEDTSE